MPNQELPKTLVLVDDETLAKACGYLSLNRDTELHYAAKAQRILDQVLYSAALDEIEELEDRISEYRISELGNVGRQLNEKALDALSRLEDTIIERDILQAQLSKAQETSYLPMIPDGKKIS